MNGVRQFMFRFLQIGVCLSICAVAMDAQAHFNAGVCTPKPR